MSTVMKQIEPPAIEAWSHAAGKRSGDFIVRHETSDTITVVLADATGHGEKAAAIAGYLRPFIEREICMGLSEALIRRWHEIVYDRFAAEHRFVCITALQLNLSTQMLTIVNGGNPDVVIRRGFGRQLERFPSTGMPLGILDSDEWKIPTFQQTFLGGADLVVCFSDGLVDCLGRNGERFGLGRVFGAVQFAGEQSPLKTLRRGLLQFQSPWEEQDDISILVLRGRYRRVA